jgi:hypothetical protein
MFVVIERVLKENVKYQLKLPTDKDYKKIVHWITDRETLRKCLLEIADKNELDVNNENDLDELDNYIDILVNPTIKHSRDYLYKN